MSITDGTVGSDSSFLAGESTPFQFNPFDAAFYTDPYPLYAQLRRQDPVHWGIPAIPGTTGVWFLARYADNLMVLKDPRFGREETRSIPTQALPPLPDSHKPFAHVFSHWLPLRDPPAHTRLRALVNKAFTPRIVEGLRPRIEEITHSLLDPVQGRGDMDLIAEFAFPLPITVIAELLGVPAAERVQFKVWSNVLVRAIDVRVSNDAWEQASQVVLEMTAYLNALIAERRRYPRSDLISALVSVHEQGDQLSGDELIGMIILLLAAGHETTVNLIGNGVLALLRHPDQLDKLRHDPALIRSAVEELLRYDSPVQIAFRMAMADVEIGGKTVRAGENVAILLGAANRDPVRFPDPHRLDITRGDNHHLAFGNGIHFCLGAPLARLEGQIAIHALLQRMPHLQLGTDSLAWRESIMFRGLRALPVRF